MACERDLKAKIRKLVAPQCYIQSMSSYATNGTPDIWCSGYKGDVWLEVKWDDKTKGAITPKLSALQQKWLNDRYMEGRNVVVIVGTSLSEGIIYRYGAWNGPRNDRLPLTNIIDLLLEGVTHD